MISLTAEQFRLLVAGQTVPSVGFNICLSDIGFEEMRAAIADAEFLKSVHVMAND